MLRWCDVKSSRHLNRIYKNNSTNVDRKLDRTRANKLITSLDGEIAHLRKNKCLVGCRTLNTAMSLLCRWGYAPEAETFLKMIDVPDYRTYEILIKGYAKIKNENSESKIKSLLVEHKKRGFSETIITYNALLKCVANRPNVIQRKGWSGDAIHPDASQIIHNMHSNCLVPNIETVHRALLCCSSLSMAELFFKNNFSSHIEKKLIIHTFAILAAREGNVNTTIKFLDEACRGKPFTIRNYNVLLHSYAMSLNIDKCLMLLEEIKSKKLQPTGVTYNTIIHCCILCAENKNEDYSHSFLEATAETIIDESNTRSQLSQSLFNSLMRLYSVTSNSVKADDLLVISKRAGYPPGKSAMEYYKLAKQRRGNTKV